MLLPTSAAGPSAASSRAVQTTLDDLGTPLAAVTFVVVDLETTGGAPDQCGITEIGAVKVRGGEALGEFQTLVHPGAPIPPFIALLTGITDAMVATAPPVEAALPAFLEFARGAVLVAHNAPFDTGFLKAACARTGLRWPDPAVLDTARLARHVVTRDEAPNCKLATLARTFRSATTPDHRALTDARATVDVLHGMLERLGSLGVTSLEELTTYTSRVSPAQRRKRHLAHGLPSGPGVYVFRDAHGRALYVGRSKDVRSRVRTYFTASESRTRMAEMVGVAESVTAVPCATELEASVRELRLIAEHAPRYNRRSKHPERASWVKLTVEPFPRLSLVPRVRDDGATYLGPFGSRRAAQAAVDALHEAVPLRRCTPRLSPRRTTAACALAGMGRCGAPCEGGETVEQYAVHADAVRRAMTADAGPLVERLAARVASLAERERFEEAATQRDRLVQLVRACARRQRLLGLTAVRHLVAARPAFGGGWELACVRWGRLAGSALAPTGTDPRAVVASLVAAAEHVEPALLGTTPTPAATAEETELVLRWLEEPGIRLVEVDGEWACPVDGAGSQTTWLRALPDQRASVWPPSEDRRALRPVAQPAALLGTTSRAG